jgi:enediyne biosynthesis protein E3
MMTSRDPGFLSRATDQFQFADPSSAQRTSDIARTFLAGYNILANGGSPAEVTSAAAGVPRYFRPFFYEGAAMGFGPLCWHTGGRIGMFERFASALSPATVYQNYVGLGWWLGTIYRWRPRRIARIVSGLDFRYRLLCYEGMGFRDGFLSAGRRMTPAGVRATDSAATGVWCQGYGRSLWFVHMGDVAGAIGAATAVPAARVADCVSGVGLGVAFSYLDRITDLEQACRQVPGHLLAEFEQGLSFGWEARQLADRDLFDRHAAALPPAARCRVEKAVAGVQQARDRLARNGDQGDFYVRWRREVVEVMRGAPVFPPSPVR